MVEESICCICEANFRSDVMVGNKCMICHELYPKANSKQEAREPSKSKAEVMSDKVVREMIYEVLEEANIKRFKCDKCGKLYFKTSPAQRQCAKCKESK
jgi:hypothetical protein